jgi:hypothetical protein
MRFGDLRFDRAIICANDALDGRYCKGETLLLIKGLSGKYRYAAVVAESGAQWVGLRDDALKKTGEKYSIVACCYSALDPTILNRCLISPR